MGTASVKQLVTLGARVARSNFGRNARPFKLTLIVTWTCDARCRMCNIWKRPKDGVMTLEEVDRFFARNPWFSWVNVSGGEIFTRPDAKELLGTVVARSRDLFLMDFPTTGQQTDKIAGAVESLLATRLPKLLVTVSLDGPPETHDDVRGRKGAFDNALATFAALRKLRSRRFGVYLGMTLSSWNRGRIFETLEAVRAVVPDAGPRDLHVNLAQESAHYYQNAGMGRSQTDVLADLAEFVEERGSSLHPVAWLERRYQQLVPGFATSGATPLPCKALASSVFVDAKWNVYPCSMYDAPLGNLRDNGFDLDAVWNSPTTSKLQGEIAERRCPNCWTPCEAYQTILGNLLRPAR
jgi:MoaA/NifB/PqqE/SkfB family radical SAM enzyme